ncbi:hypothetical protein [Streptomyces griseus]
MPDQGPGTLLNGAALAVPVAAALAVAWCTVRRAAPADAPRAQAWSPRETALVTLLAALVLRPGDGAAHGGGRLGRWVPGRSSAFGPVWWLTGAAALAWTAVVVRTGGPAAAAVAAAHPGLGLARDVDAETGVDADGGVAEMEGALEAADQEEFAVASAPLVGRRGVGGVARRTRRRARPVTRRPGRTADTRDRPRRMPLGRCSRPPARHPKPASRRAAGAGRRAEAGCKPCDFLPTDPWHGKDLRRGPVGLPGNRGAPAA